MSARFSQNRGQACYLAHVRTLVLGFVAAGLCACGLFVPTDEEDTDDPSDGADGPAWLAVGDQGTVLRSVDGAEWEIQSSGTTRGLYAVAADVDRVVAVGEAGTMVVSTDGGQTWLTGAAATTHDLRAIVFHRDRFVAVGGTSSGETVVSYDAVTWTRPDLANPVQPLHGLATNPAGLVAIGDDPSTGFALYLWEEGFGWRQQIDGASTGARYDAVAAWTSGFVLIGVGSAATSTDATLWTAIPVFAPLKPRSLAATPQGWVAAGDDGGLLLSIDALAWTAQVTGTTAHLHAIANDGLQTVIVGEQGTIVRSEDGVFWAQTPAPVMVSLRGVAAVGG